MDRVLRELSPVFDRMYGDSGRLSIPPEHLLRRLLIVLYDTREFVGH